MKAGLAVAVSLVLLPSVLLAADPELPVPIQTSQGVRYYNGGVGVDERKALPQLYPLKIVLATDKGLFLNDADVIIRSGGKEIIRVKADRGPWIVADVAPGSYSVEATLEGRTAKASISVSPGARKVAVLTWKTSEIDMGL